MIDLGHFFTQRGMTFETIENGGISSAFAVTLPDNKEHAFGFFVLPLTDNFGDSYTRFTIVPFVEQPYDGFPEKLYVTLTQINHDLPGLKFAVDEDGDLELVLDVPTSKLEDVEFDRVMQVVADYARAYYPELTSVVSASQ